MNYKILSKILTPIDKLFNVFGFYIVFNYKKGNSDYFNKVDGVSITHKSKLN